MSKQKYYVCVFNKTGFECKEITSKQKIDLIYDGNIKIYNDQQVCRKECKENNEQFKRDIPKVYENLYTTDGWMGQLKHIYALTTKNNIFTTIRYPFTPEFLQNEVQKSNFSSFLEDGNLFKVASALHLMANIIHLKLGKLQKKMKENF